jgi:Leucine-rich repeat (LRR) protein
MKKLVSVILTLALCAVSACAFATEADYSKYTDEQLLKIRDDVNNEIASRIISTQQQSVVDGEKTLRDLFPSLPLAKLVRDKAGLVSVDQPVTQEALGRITSIDIDDIPAGDKVDEFTGIEYLANLRSIYVYTWSRDKISAMATLPDGIGNLQKLERIYLYGSNLVALPDSIGSLSSLRELTVYGSNITDLPDSIGNLSSLKVLDISNTDISVLPDSIGNLSSPESLDISNTKITALPRSIYNLHLKTFEKKGLDIE